MMVNGEAVASQCDPYCLYVQLSRCRTLDGIMLLSKVRERDFVGNSLPADMATAEKRLDLLRSVVSALAMRRFGVRGLKWHPTGIPQVGQHFQLLPGASHVNQLRHGSSRVLTPVTGVDLCGWVDGDNFRYVNCTSIKPAGVRLQYFSPIAEFAPLASCRCAFLSNPIGLTICASQQAPNNPHHFSPKLFQLLEPSRTEIPQRGCCLQQSAMVIIRRRPDQSKKPFR
ncbi:hypothetical protein B0J13DRAFT_199346 [Dactylonectria estremocensis]|uniref:Uncharacterized protein n=1 Tax=Dactylonectria estremocensis TaxID=1079267 RepID=A0A9P9DGD1_9HYPO|nr:hypothetical protein B0J13DRAFT_199346 [Dactylonectria estremocensis]